MGNNETIEYGERHGKLIIAVEVLPRIEKSGYKTRMVLCRCDCGTVKNYPLYMLRRDHVDSCGCSPRRTTGKPTDPIYKLWAAMINRCTNPHCKSYKNYGGRGISVCARWLGSERTFANDMGPRPTGMSLERIDNNGNYCPENCKWGTNKEQGRNRRNNRLLTLKGRTQCLSAWAEEQGIKNGTLIQRLLHGWSVEAALTTPVGSKRPI